MKLFTYWEGPKPAHIELCLATIEASCRETEYVHVTPQTIRDWVDPCVLHENFSLLVEPAHRADCLRAALLATHGGFYFDADTIGIRDPAELAEDYDLVYCIWNNKPTRVLNGYVYAKPGSKLAAHWLEGVNAALASLPYPEGEEMPWTALGEQVLTPLVHTWNKQRPQRLREVDRSTFLPIDVDSRPQWFFEPGDPQKFITPLTVCFGLNNSYMSHWHPDEMAMSPEEMAKSQLLIHRLFTSARERLT